MTADGRRLPEFVAADGRRIRLRECRPDGEAAGVIQILHGLAEHSARYDRFAADAAAAGYLVVTHDHRGHGPDHGGERLGHFADDGGWQRVVGDVAAVNAAIRQAASDVPLTLLGHSMGSYVAQSFLMQHPQSADRLILSGTTWPDRREVRLARWLAQLVALVRGKRRQAFLLDRMSFGKFNDRFAPVRTPFDWLSRDEAEVDRYVDDPLCGFVASNRLWIDLLGGLLEIGTREALSRIPAGLPILILGGEADPVGGRSGLARLADEYRATGHDDVTLKIYPGARHEMLNESNRSEVTADILGWLNPSP